MSTLTKKYFLSKNVPKILIILKLKTSNFSHLFKSLYFQVLYFYVLYFLKYLSIIRYKTIIWSILTYIWFLYSKSIYIYIYIYIYIIKFAILGLVANFPCFNLLSKFSFVYLLNSGVGINLSWFMARFFF